MKVMPDVEPLFVLQFRNVKSKRSIVATFFPPTLQQTYIPEHQLAVGVWNCDFHLRVGDRTYRKVATGSDWLQSLLLAIEFLHKKIPLKQAEDWVTEEGLPSWIVLPRTVPYSWGYSLYAKLANELVDGEKAFVSAIDLKRRKAEKK